MHLLCRNPDCSCRAERIELGEREAVTDLFDHLAADAGDFSLAVWDSAAETVADLNRALLNLSNAQSDAEILARGRSLRMWLHVALAAHVERQKPVVRAQVELAL